MKNFLLLIALFSFLVSFSQNKIPYFPQEQIVLEKCTNTPNSSACIYRHYQTILDSILKPKIEDEKLFYKDTISVGLHYSVNTQGEIDKEMAFASISDSILRKNTEKAIKSVILSTPKFTVENQKDAKYEVKHRFLYRLTTAQELKFIPINRTYEGGEIMEFPAWKDCINKRIGKEGRVCFNTKMQEHIRKNFRYPKKAQRKGLQGKVYVMFKINEKGKVSNIRTRGPHYLLEEEGKRIIQLLPKIKPGTINGNAVNVPFSIPINFKLR